MDRPREGWPDGHVLSDAWSLPTVEVHASIGSTQDRAFELARSGGAPWTAVVATRQSEGRGRRGDPWESKGGLGLWMSFVLPPDSASEFPVPLRLGLLLAEAVEAALGPTKKQESSAVAVKWPNDVWVSGRKIAGILAERAGGHTVAGIGLNLFHQKSDFGPAVRARATSLALEGWTGDPVAMVGSMMRHIRAEWSNPSSDVLRRLRMRDALLGRSLVDPQGRHGIGAGIGDDGALKMSGNDSEWGVLAGAVTLVDPAAETKPAKDG